ncbi:tetratricopeptide repeat-containing protein [Streptomyces narbonensis]|uniref:Tetratricopeptide repeat-containing protein n=1 Tax=Streptomyces narbonensis TaxID=67333 RepID=A0ABV3CM81_9ACTN
MGPYSSVVVQQAVAPQGVDWPLEVGAVPALASAFQPRAGLRERIDAVREEGATAVLTQVLSGGGGVGKSQLAASYASQAVAEGVDLVVWAPAAELQQVVTRFAEAGVRVEAPGVTGADPEADARAFLAWLATTSRRWLVVLDDIADPGAVEGWWPVSRTGSGWVLATTRLHDARLTGGGRRRVSVDVYEPDEAAAYLRARLAEDDGLVDGAVDELAGALGYLPLALGHAAAYMINHGVGCAAYLRLFRGSRSIAEVLPPSADAEGYGRQIATTLLLSLGAAEEADPAGLARAVLSLAAFLDPAGHPAALWAMESVLSSLGGCDAATVRTTLRVLHRYALLTCDGDAVRIHALTARAVREVTPDEVVPLLALTAADGLYEIWPEPDQPHRALAAVLRANTDVLTRTAGDHLWDPDGHEVLFRAGTSLIHAGLAESATAHWSGLASRAERLLGPEHPTTLGCRTNLSACHAVEGRVGEAMALTESVLVDRERVLGPGHPDTLAARANVAVAIAGAGHLGEAVLMTEQVLADGERAGLEDRDTLPTRLHLAELYREVGRVGEAVVLAERILADSERVLGADHPDLPHARSVVADCYMDAGRCLEAVALRERSLADAERLLGPDHVEVLSHRTFLAAFYWAVGRTGEALSLMDRTIADSERLLGPEHPGTLASREFFAVMRHPWRFLWRRILRRRPLPAADWRPIGDHRPGGRPPVRGRPGSSR